jgi:hypothetical protein
MTSLRPGGGASGNLLDCKGCREENLGPWTPSTEQTLKQDCVKSFIRGQRAETRGSWVAQRWCRS